MRPHRSNGSMKVTAGLWQQQEWWWSRLTSEGRPPGRGGSWPVDWYHLLQAPYLVRCLGQSSDSTKRQVALGGPEITSSIRPRLPLQRRAGDIFKGIFYVCMK